MKVTKASIILEINGHPHAVILSGVNLDLLAGVIGAAMPEGRLRVFRLGDDVRFETFQQDELAEGKP